MVSTYYIYTEILAATKQLLKHIVYYILMCRSYIEGRQKFFPLTMINIL